MPEGCHFNKAMSMLLPATIPGRASLFRCTAILLWGATACTPMDGRQIGSQGVLHPVDAFRITPVKIVGRLALTLPVSIGHQPPYAIGGFAPASEERRIGALEAPAEEVFGTIADVDVDAEGRVYVLDSRFNQVRIFSPSGTLIEAVGRPGAGPGDLRAPSVLTVAHDRRLYVADRPTHIHVFDRIGGKYRFQRTVSIDVTTSDMCVMGDTLFVQGVKFGRNVILHKFDRDLHHVASFGSVYESGNAMVDWQTSSGRITCAEREQIVVYAPTSLLGEVRGFGTDGRLVWVTRLEGFRPIEVFVRPDGGRRVTVPEQGYNRVRSVVYSGPDDVIVQVAYETRESQAAKKEFEQLVTIHLNPRSGQGSVLSRDFPLISKITSSLLVSQREDPFPSVGVQLLKARD